MWATAPRGRRPLPRRRDPRGNQRRSRRPTDRGESAARGRARTRPQPAALPWPPLSARLTLTSSLSGRSSSSPAVRRCVCLCVCLSCRCLSIISLSVCHVFVRRSFLLCIRRLDHAFAKPGPLSVRVFTNFIPAFGPFATLAHAPVQGENTSQCFKIHINAASFKTQSPVIVRGCMSLTGISVACGLYGIGTKVRWR